jgi:hypothetical protein
VFTAHAVRLYIAVVLHLSFICDVVIMQKLTLNILPDVVPVVNVPCDLKFVPKVITQEVVVLVILRFISCPTHVEGIVPLFIVIVEFVPTFNVHTFVPVTGVSVTVEPAVRAEAVLQVCSVPPVGNVSPVVPVDVRVIAYAPEVIRDEPVTSVNVALVVGAVIVTLFNDVTVGVALQAGAVPVPALVRTCPEATAARRVTDAGVAVLDAYSISPIVVNGLFIM